MVHKHERWIYKKRQILPAPHFKLLGSIVEYSPLTSAVKFVKTSYIPIEIHRFRRSGRNLI
jgi:hypothetical protein